MSLSSNLMTVPVGDETLLDAETGSTHPDPQQHALLLKKKLEEAVAEVGRLQSGITAHDELQRLLKQGRTLLQEMRGRLDEVTTDRNRLEGELGDTRTRLAEVESEREKLDGEKYQLQRQFEEALARQREMGEDLDEQRKQIDSLREAAVRAQALAREIMNAHEAARAV